MATRRYSIGRGTVVPVAGTHKDGIVEAAGAATATKSMEFTFDLTAGLTKEDVLKGLELIAEYIAADSFPPA